MPLGLNRSGDFANGNPITLPHTFGNPVTWVPSPAHFGNAGVGSAPPTPTQATPTFTPVGGSYGPAQSVVIASAGADAIYYTTDGSTPTTNSALYAGAVTVATSETLRAIAVRAGYNTSAVGSTSYAINGACGTPAFTPPAGTFSSAQSVTITSANATAIYYTTDGSTPTTSSTPYTGAIAVSASETIEAIGVAAGYSNSAVGSAAYIIQSYVFVDNVTDLSTPSAWTVGGNQGTSAVVSSTQEVSAGVTSLYMEPYVPWGETEGAYGCIDCGVTPNGHTFNFAVYLPTSNCNLNFIVGATSTGANGIQLQVGKTTGLAPYNDPSSNWSNGYSAGGPAASANVWHNVTLIFSADGTTASWRLDGVPVQTGFSVYAGMYGAGGTWMGFNNGPEGDGSDGAYVSQITIA